MATSLNNLAELYRALGNYAKAEPLYKRALAILKKALGSDHPNVAITLNNLAELYRDTNRINLAVPLEQRAAQIRASNVWRSSTDPYVPPGPTPDFLLKQPSPTGGNITKLQYEALSAGSPTLHEGEDVTTPIPVGKEPFSIAHPQAAKKPWHMPAPTTSREYKSPYTGALVEGHPRIISGPKSPRELLEIAERGRRGAIPIPSNYYNKEMTFLGKRVDKPSFPRNLASLVFFGMVVCATVYALKLWKRKKSSRC